jgi:hypothetical protein
MLNWQAFSGLAPEVCPRLAAGFTDKLAPAAITAAALRNSRRPAVLSFIPMAPVR